MEYAASEVAAVQSVLDQEQGESLNALNDLQLSLVGDGCGDISLG